MLKTIGVALAFLFPVEPAVIQMSPAYQFAGVPTDRPRWFRKKSVLWFNGFPGWPKLPLVQRLRASPSSSNPVASSQPEEEDGEDQEDDPEPLL